MKNEESTVLGHPPTTPFPTTSQAPLHLKYTCGKHAVSNSASLYTLFYSVIYNSVHRGLKFFVFFLVSEAPWRCRVVVVSTPQKCHVPSSALLLYLTDPVMFILCESMVLTAISAAIKSARPLLFSGPRASRPISFWGKDLYICRAGGNRNGLLNLIYNTAFSVKIRRGNSLLY